MSVSVETTDVGIPSAHIIYMYLPCSVCSNPSYPGSFSTQLGKLGMGLGDEATFTPAEMNWASENFFTNTHKSSHNYYIGRLWTAK